MYSIIVHCTTQRRQRFVILYYIQICTKTFCKGAMNKTLQGSKMQLVWHMNVVCQLLHCAGELTSLMNIQPVYITKLPLKLCIFNKCKHSNIREHIIVRDFASMHGPTQNEKKNLNFWSWSCTRFSLAWCLLRPNRCWEDNRNIVKCFSVIIKTFVPEVGRAGIFFLRLCSIM